MIEKDITAHSLRRNVREERAARFREASPLFVDHHECPEIGAASFFIGTRRRSAVPKGSHR